MITAKHTLTALLCIILAITLGAAGLVALQLQDTGNISYIGMFMLLLLAIPAPLLNFLQRDKFRAGGLVLALIFLTLWGTLALVTIGWYDSKWFTLFYMLLVNAMP